MHTSEEPLGIKARQGESLNLCHSSKGPWLKVSVDVTCSTQVLSVFHKVEERIHKMRGVDSLGLETKLRLRSQRYLVQALNSTTPRGFLSFVIVTTSPMMTLDDVTSCAGRIHRSQHYAYSTNHPSTQHVSYKQDTTITINS
jgi:hypothetical protein